METAFNGVTFRIGGDTFAVDALRVREVVGRAEWQPLAAEGEKGGFIQVRGRTVPVLDLREKFGFPGASKEGMSSFIVVQAEGNDRNRQVALWVDTLLAMLSVPREQLGALKNALGAVPDRFLKAVVESGEGPIYLLELDEVLGEKELVLENRAS